MNPVIPCSVGNVSLVPGTAFSTRKNNSLTILSLSRKSVKHGSSTRRFLSPQFVSIGLFPQNKRRFSFHKKSRTPISAVETEVVVEEPDSPVAEEGSVAASEAPSDEVGISEDSSPKSDTSPSPATSRRSRSPRKSEMPPIKNEDLIPGATFTGKVKSIQPFGAFVDFGAFTDGLVHVSRLSDSYVKDVANVVSVGQEVKVKLIEVNTETQRISLSMRENDDIGKLRQQKDEPISAEKAGPGRRNTSKSSLKKDGLKKNTKFVKGQDLEGAVKNMTRSGAFISLPDGEEGFLPISEESDEGFGNVMGTSSLQVGQEVSVRVLRINRGQVTLTMKKDEDNAKLDSELSQEVVQVATNPFVLAFRNNKDIATFLDEREKMQKAVEKPSTVRTSEEIKGSVKQLETALDVPDVQEDPGSSKKLVDSVPSAVKDNAEDDISGSEAGVGISTLDDVSKAIVDEREPASNISSPMAPEGDISTANQFVEEAPQTDDIASNVKTDSSLEIANENVIESGVDHIVAEDETDHLVVEDEKHLQTSNAEEEFTTAAPTDNDGVEPGPDENDSSTGSDIKSSAPAPQELADDKVGAVFGNNGGDASSRGQIGVLSSEGSLNTDGIEGNDQVLSPESHSSEVVNNLVDIPKEDAQKQTPANENEKPFTSQVEGKEVGITSPGNSSLSDANGQTGVASSVQGLSKDGTEGNDQVLSPKSHSSEVVNNLVDIPKEDVQKQTPANGNEKPFTSQVEDKEVGITSPKNSSLSDANGQTGVAASEQDLNKVTITPALVKQLREETGAGMMDCKKALSEAGGNIVKAQEFLRKKGLASAEKKASRATAEGRIGSYIHDSRIGILVEVNCETDFVSRGEIFKELIDDIAMQVAACPQVEYLVTEDVPEEIVNQEKEIEMQKEDLLSKPEQIRSKIVEGRIRKRLEELALLEQPYIKNDKVAVKDWVKQTIATVGENIKVKRFVRFNLGEGLEKKSQDFAAEVAAQTAAKPVPTAGKEQPAITEAKETEQKPSTVTVSAALVKQLREETGAGMMDCKKALAETGGDLEKAQEYLRKKGLSTAEKKSNRLAAEGRIGSYIHDSRIGVLIEVNCETDFVGRSEKFRELVDDLAMQVVACPQVQFVSIEDIPESIVNKEKELEMQREDLLSKPENIRERIVEGRISKRLGELALLEQPFIKDDSFLVKDLIKQTVAAIGENIKVRRFVRFTLGETAENETTPA